MFLDGENIAGLLDDSARARLLRDAKALTVARDRDREERAERQQVAEARAQEVLTPRQADALKTELEASGTRKKAITEHSGRITTVLQEGSRLDPQDTADREDAGHHFEITLKPALSDLDPVERARAVGGYVALTGVALAPAVKSLLADGHRRPAGPYHGGVRAHRL